MMRQTGCDGVIIGRGCLGRPWLFRELAQVFNGQEPDDPPSLGEVTSLLLDHARLLVEYFGSQYPVTVAVAGNGSLFDPDNERIRC